MDSRPRRYRRIWRRCCFDRRARRSRSCRSRPGPRRRKRSSVRPRRFHPRCHKPCSRRCTRCHSSSLRPSRCCPGSRAHRAPRKTHRNCRCRPRPGLCRSQRHRSRWSNNQFPARHKPRRCRLCRWCPAPCTSPCWGSRHSMRTRPLRKSHTRPRCTDRHPSPRKHCLLPRRCPRRSSRRRRRRYHRNSGGRGRNVSPVHSSTAQ